MKKKFSQTGAASSCNAAGDSPALHFLYRTALGRIFLKGLVHPVISRMAGRYLSSHASKWLVPYYIRKHKIDMTGVEIPLKGFTSFNDFFTRKRMVLPCRGGRNALVNPCDGWLRVEEIRDTTVLTVKAAGFSLEELLEDKALAEQFRDGTALVFRLTPADYHRYCYAAGGRVLAEKRIGGRLHCVRPIALREVPAFVQNSREYQVIRTERFGIMVQMEVGALLVGKIRNHDRGLNLNSVQQGAEKGYFEFGGSTIVLLLQKDMVRISLNGAEEKNEAREKSAVGEKNGTGGKSAAGEIRVRMGQRIAVYHAGGGAYSERTRVNQISCRSNLNKSERLGR